MENWAIGIDLGATKALIAKVNEKGEIEKDYQFYTHAKPNFDAVLNELQLKIESFIQENPTPPIGIGVGVAGQVEKNTGVVISAPNLGWNLVPLAEILKKFGSPVYVLNDVRAATLAEYFWGAGKDCPHLLCIFWGTGIGGGVISGGKLLEGASNTAGEIGHIPINFKGPVCSCGNKGCIEAYAGGWALAKRARDRLQENVDAEGLIQLRQKGNADAAEILEEAEFAFISWASGLINGFNPKKIVLGGGVMQGLPHMIGKLEKQVKELALSAAVNDLEILPAKFSQKGVSIGAAAAALKNVINLT